MEDNLQSKIDRFKEFKVPIALSLVGIVLIAGGIFASGLTKPFSSPSKQFPKESLVQKQTIAVDIEGAVISPGVYKLDSDSRIEDIVKSAGGYSEKANKEYIAKSLNLAQKLVDGSKVYVPFEGESGSQNQSGGVAGNTAQTTVNINIASESDLEALSGIGPATASKIISSRPYQNIEELVSKKIIGKALFEKLKDQLIVY